MYCVELTFSCRSQPCYFLLTAMPDLDWPNLNNFLYVFNTFVYYYALAVILIFISPRNVPVYLRKPLI